MHTIKRALLVLAAVAACGDTGSTGPKAGDACTLGPTESAGCEEITRSVLYCDPTTRKLFGVQCAGPAGCSVSSGRVVCDYGPQDNGGRCPPNGDGYAACGSVATDVLQCMGTYWRVAQSCMVPSLCKEVGGKVGCN